MVCALALTAGCSSKAAREVHLFTWDNYDDPAVFAEFEAGTGIRVVVDRFASNEELLAKLMGGARGYDVIVPSDYMVPVMARQGLLTALDKAKTPNLSHIDPRFRDLSYDPGNRYCVPYLWGITGIGYDSDRLSAPPTGWSVFWDPARAGRISLLNDPREVFAMGLQSMGYKAGNTDPAVLEKVKARLAEQKRLTKTYVSENISALLLSGEVDVAHLWSGDLFRAAAQKPSLRFVIPKEGGFIFQDNLCVPRTAPDPEAALKLIDFMLEPRNIARIVEKTYFGCPNRTAWELLPETLRKNPGIVPQGKTLDSLEWIPDAGEAGAVYDRLWTELKAL
ncbi:MAG: hypothetical protein A2X36_11385 [Elusimicrobia bacterium GWA2_69_24]|nr:MAG: hypothetical protein A2X36_11385 [Elusimicrobia bacterium GWA2_69_24]